MDAIASQQISQAISTLEAARRQLSIEIRGYPTPIAGCDAQFNQLLVERRRVEKALHALAEPLHVPTPRDP